MKKSELHAALRTLREHPTKDVDQALLNFIREVEWFTNPNNAQELNAQDKLHAQALMWIRRLRHLDKAG